MSIKFCVRCDNLFKTNKKNAKICLNCHKPNAGSFHKWWEDKPNKKQSL